jgi:hypothetical protein
MVEFAEEEHLTMSDLNEKAKADFGRLPKLAAAFAMAQKQLESNEFRICNLFTSHVLTLEHRFDDFRECKWRVYDVDDQRWRNV